MRAISVSLSKNEAKAVIDLVVIEIKKARLKFLFYDDEHPLYDKIHEDNFSDVQMGIYEKTIYYLESAFGIGSFKCLI